jgi:hypothetical protein
MATKLPVLPRRSDLSYIIYAIAAADRQIPMTEKIGGNTFSCVDGKYFLCSDRDIRNYDS